MQNIKNVTTLNGNSVQLEIDLTAAAYTVNGHSVNSITLFAETGEYGCCGDLAVNWAYAESDNAGYTESAMLMRNNNSDDNVTETMGLFYWDGEFTSTLKQVLVDNGFSASAAAEVCTSEWGMQDAGRASYDANEIAEEMLTAHNLELEAA